MEINSQLEVSIALQFINEEDCEELNFILMEEFKMLTKMIEG